MKFFLMFFQKFNLFIDPERRLECVKNKEQRYWLLLKEYENFIRCDLSLFEVKKRGKYKIKRNRRLAIKQSFRWKKKIKCVHNERQD